MSKRHGRIAFTSLLAATVLFASACGLNIGRKSSGEDAVDASAPASGCLEGVVINGITGERLDLTSEGATTNFFVLVSPYQIRASALAGPETPSLLGEYRLCGVPVEAEFPLYIDVPGYEAFESRVYVPATDRSRSNGADTDLYSQAPTALANVRLFPTTETAKSYEIVVSFAGAPVEGAAVQLMPTGINVAAQGSGFLAPNPTGYKTLKGTTDASGVATFTATDLALGGVYKYQVLPADGAMQRAANGTLSVGYVTTPSDPYRTHVDLEPVNSELIVVSSSQNNSDYSEDGSITYQFNRAVELVPNTLDGVRAQLLFAVTSALEADVPNNDASEQVDVVISGTSLTLKPKLTSGPTKATEPELGISYTGINVRPTTGQKLLHTLSLSPTVTFFGGQAPLTSVTIVSGNAQQNSPGMALAAPLVVQVSDERGTPMGGVPVTFAATAGNGTFSATTVTTNNAGQAQTFWTLGASGTQTATATVSGLPPVTFNATFLPATSIAFVGGNGQSQYLGGKLNSPVTVRIRDSNLVAVPDANVVFTVADTTNGGLLNKIGNATTATTQTVVSDANGEASVEWTMGSVAGGYSVNIASGTASSVQASATALGATIVKTSGDNPATPAPGSSSNFVVTLQTPGSVPIQGATLRFATTTTGATLQVGAGAAAATVTGTTDASGQVTVAWKKGSQNTTLNTVVVSLPSGPSIATVSFTATTN